LPVQRKFFVDVSSQLVINQVAALPASQWQPAPEVLARGFTDSAIWLRLEVPAQPDAAPSPMLLRLLPVYLDDVRVYTPTGTANRTATTDSQAGWTLQQAGDIFPFDTRSRDEIAYTFDLGSTSPDQAQIFFVRVHTQSQAGISAMVLAPQESEQREDLTKMLFGLFVGLTLLLVWRAWMGWRTTKDRLWLLAGVFQLGSIWVGVVFMGMAGKYLMPQQSVDMLGSLGGCFHLLVGSIFYALVYRSYGVPLWANLINFRHLLLFPLQLWLLWHGQVRQAMHLNTQSLFWGTIISTFLIVFLLRSTDRKQLWLLRINIVLPFIALIWLSGAQLAIFPGTYFQVFPMLPFNIIAGVLMDALLSRRWQLAHDAALGAQAQLGHTQQLLKLEQSRLQEKESFMSMLMHELKNPLAAIRTAAINRRYDSIDTSVGSIDAVLERVRQIDRVESGKQAVHMQSHDVRALLQTCADLCAAPDRVVLSADPSLLNLNAELDPLLLQHMVTNLLDNALKYGDLAHPILLSLHSADATDAPAFVVRVSNTVGSAGCPDTTQVFNKYYRGQHSQTQSGTGLGLYMVALLSKLCHARVSCHTDMQTLPASVWFDLTHPIAQPKDPTPCPAP
jgi:signal transduction histidine kinase